MSSNIIQPKPIDELKIMIKNQETQIENISKILVQISKQLKDLKDFKEKEVIEKEKVRQGWFFA